MSGRNGVKFLPFLGAPDCPQALISPPLNSFPIGVGNKFRFKQACYKPDRKGAGLEPCARIVMIYTMGRYDLQKG